jgi:hypothetical protein
MAIISPAPQEDERDTLFGAQANVDFVNAELGTNYTVDTLYGWNHRHLVPLGKFSNHLIGSRRRWREHFAALAKLVAALAFLCVRGLG